MFFTIAKQRATPCFVAVSHMKTALHRAEQHCIPLENTVLCAGPDGRRTLSIHGVARSPTVFISNFKGISFKFAETTTQFTFKFIICFILVFELFVLNYTSVFCVM